MIRLHNTELLKADIDTFSGEANIIVTERYTEEVSHEPLLVMDILKDLICDLENMYARAKEGWEAELEDMKS